MAGSACTWLGQQLFCSGYSLLILVEGRVALDHTYLESIQPGAKAGGFGRY
jgi:hypothetical protein